MGGIMMNFKKYILMIGFGLTSTVYAHTPKLCGVGKDDIYSQIINGFEPEHRPLYQEKTSEMVDRAYKNDVESLFLLAEGLAVVNEDYEKSKCIFEMISKRQDDYAKSAMLRLSSYYEYGFHGYPKDYIKHLYWSEKLAEIEPNFYAVVANSYYNIANSDENAENETEHKIFHEFAEKSMYWALKSSANNEGEGDFIVAQLYANGLGVEKNLEKAISYYKKAIERFEPLLQENPSDGSAIFNLSLAYTYLGEAYYAIKDYENAKIILEKDIALSEFHSSRSYYNLSLLYRYGYGVQKDIKKADEFYKKSCELGYVPACENS